MTFHRPIKTTCAKGHARKQVSTTGAWYCPTCQKENARKLAAKRKPFPRTNPHPGFYQACDTIPMGY